MGEHMENYQLKLDKTISALNGRTPTLLLHSCCAPCSSYVLEYLSRYFKLTLLYYNPNITEVEEYSLRVKEQQRLISEMPLEIQVEFLEGKYEPKDFFEIAKGLEKEKEGGARCEKCYRLRLEYAAKKAKELGFDYFCTTLSISPLKNAEKLNAIGAEVGKEYGVEYLFSDFKKKNGYKRSIELSNKYSLYRQNYCGCVYSKNQNKRKEM